MTNIIIDTDPGVDDALAIMMLVKSGQNVMGLTTVFGNSSVADSTKNSLSVLEMCKESSIPVFQGAKEPMIGRATRAESHGIGAFGEYKLVAKNGPSEKSVFDFYVEALTAGKKSVDILAIGPLTNIANLISRRPELAEKINSIVIMTGVFGQEGNITEYAEFNAYNDPEALDIVLKSQLRKVIVPANVCRSVLFDSAVFEKLQGDSAEGVGALTKMYVDYYKNNTKFETFKGAVMYDLVAAAYLLKPGLLSMKKTRIAVVLGGDERGRTVVDSSGSECLLAVDAKCELIKKLFLDCLNLRNIGEYK